MKYFLAPLIFLVLLVSCSSEDSSTDRNPNLVDLNFNISYNLTLPQYNQLNFPGNSFQDYNIGITGINVYYLSNNQYIAFELTDPNHPLVDCSTLVVNGIEASCQCEDNVYNLISGEQTAGAQGQYTLKPYRIERNGDVITISN